MTLEELRTKKEDLEMEIERLLTAFSSETQLGIDALHLRGREVIGSRIKFYVVDVEVKL